MCSGAILFANSITSFWFLHTAMNPFFEILCFTIELLSHCGNYFFE